MSRFTKPDKMRRFSLAAVFIFAGVLTMASTAWSMGRPGTCEGDPDGSNVSIGVCMEDMLRNQLEMLDEVESMILDLSNMGLFSMGRSQSGVDIQAELLEEMTKLQKQSRRASAANEAISDNEYDQFFDKGDMKKGNKCKLSDITYYNSLEADNYLPPGIVSVESSEFGNNKCDIFTATNEDSEVIKVNERKENMCEQVCEEKTNPGNGQSRRGESKDRLKESLLDSIDSARTATQTIATQRIHMQQLGVLLSGIDQLAGVSPLSSHTMGCTPPATGPSTELTLAIVKQSIVVGLEVTILAADLVKKISRGAKDTVEGVLELDVAGFNLTIGKIPPSLIHSLANAISGVLNHIKNFAVHAVDGYELTDKVNKSNEVDPADTCREALKTDTESLKASAGDTTAALADIQAEMAVLRRQMEENRALLLTPQGKRTGFPAR